MATFNPGRYTVHVTVTVLADNPRDAYRQIERALAADKRNGVTFVDAEDVKVEPFCANVGEDGEDGHDADSDRDVAVEGSTLCATCQERQSQRALAELQAIAARLGGR
jgi:hypothetical protein